MSLIICFTLFWALNIVPNIFQNKYKINRWKSFEILWGKQLTQRFEYGQKEALWTLSGRQNIFFSLFWGFFVHYITSIWIINIKSLLIWLEMSRMSRTHETKWLSHLFIISIWMIAKQTFNYLFFGSYVIIWLDTLVFPNLSYLWCKGIFPQKILPIDKIMLSYIFFISVIDFQTGIKTQKA